MFDALEEACGTIRAAPKGAQAETLQSQSRAIGFLAGITALHQDIALAHLVAAAGEWDDPDEKPGETVAIIQRSFNDGLRQAWIQIGLEPIIDIKSRNRQPRGLPPDL